MASAADRSVLRKVYFFKLANADLILDAVRQAIEHIDTLSFDSQGRYLPTVSEDIVLTLFVSQKSFPIRVQFGRVKRSDLPLIEDQGSITPLQIANSAGVLDWGHIVFFEDGIVAAEFNRDAPRLARLGEYLYFKARGILDTAPRFLPLFERSVLQELAKFNSVTLLEVEAPTNEAEAISEADGSLGAAFAACRRAGNARSAKLVLKGPTKGALLDLKELAQRLFSNSRSREAITKLKVKGRTEKGPRPLDLLQDYLVAAEGFMKLDKRSRALASDHAFKVIESAYNENKERFASAATATELW